MHFYGTKNTAITVTISVTTAVNWTEKILDTVNLGHTVLKVQALLSPTKNSVLHDE